MASSPLPPLSTLGGPLLVVATVVAGCMPFGDYQQAGAGPSAGGGGGADGTGGGGAQLGGAGGGGEKECNPLDEQNPNCADCVKNGLETDTDCGGDSCAPCALTAVCGNDADCESGNCEALVCVPASTTPACLQDPDGNTTCADCLENGEETDVDCGGDACGPCHEGDKCKGDADCATGNCVNSTCGPRDPGCEDVVEENPSCGDCEQNGSETFEDCGGDACPPCNAGDGCLIDADCLSLNCDGDTCGDPLTPECPEVDPENPTCADCAKNGLETDIDCGGDACPPCAIGDDCDNDADCASESCAAGSCAL